MVLDMLPPAQADASRVVNIDRFNFFMADKIEILDIALPNFIDKFDDLKFYLVPYCRIIINRPIFSRQKRYNGVVELLKTYLERVLPRFLQQSRGHST